MDEYIEHVANLADIIAIEETDWADYFTSATGLDDNVNDVIEALFETNEIYADEERIPYNISNKSTQPCVFEHYKLQVSAPDYEEAKASKNPLLLSSDEEVEGVSIAVDEDPARLFDLQDHFIEDGTATQLAITPTQQGVRLQSSTDTTDRFSDIDIGEEIGNLSDLSFTHLLDDPVGTGIRVAKYKRGTTVRTVDKDVTRHDRRSDEGRIFVEGVCGQASLLRGVLKMCYQHYRSILGRFVLGRGKFCPSPFMWKVRREGYGSIDFVTQYITKHKKKIRAIDITVDPCAFIPNTRTTRDRLFIRLATKNNKFYLITNIPESSAQDGETHINVYSPNSVDLLPSDEDVEARVKFAKETIRGRRLPEDTNIVIVHNKEINLLYSGGGGGYYPSDVSGLAVVGWVFLLLKGDSPGRNLLTDLDITTLSMFITNLPLRFKSVYHSNPTYIKVTGNEDAYTPEVVGLETGNVNENMENMLGSLTTVRRNRRHADCWDFIANRLVVFDKEFIELTYAAYMKWREMHTQFVRTFKLTRRDARPEELGCELTVEEWNTIDKAYTRNNLNYCDY